MREAFRQVLHSLLKPLGAIIAEELRAKLDPAAALDFSELRAGDITGNQPRPRVARQGRNHTAGSRRDCGPRRC